MNYGTLTLITGPMFSGKTEELIKEIVFRSYFVANPAEHVKSCVFKSEFDTRAGRDWIAGHEGTTVTARVIRSFQDIPEGHFDYMFFDDVQFFTEPDFEDDIVEVIRTLRREGINIFCSALNMDYQGQGFEITAQLLAEASDVRFLKGVCEVCGAPATHTKKISRTEGRYLVGARESYAPVCLHHWAEDLHDKENNIGDQF